MELPGLGVKSSFGGKMKSKSKSKSQKISHKSKWKWIQSILIQYLIFTPSTQPGRMLHIHRTMNTLSMRSLLLRYCGRGQPVRFSTAGAGTGAASSNNSSNDLVITTVNESSGIAMLTMNRPPANSLSLEMNNALCNSIKTMETNPKIQSVILSSSNPKIFSAGLDVSELINPNPDRLPQFWNSLQQLYLDMYGSRLAIVAAIQGHAPAAGCFLAMACDYRIMSAGDMGDGGNSDMMKKFVPTIGLNETQLGIAGECVLRGPDLFFSMGGEEDLCILLRSIRKSHELYFSTT